MRTFSRAVAIVFHPLFMPLYLAVIVMNFVTYFQFSIDPWIKGFLYFVLVMIVLLSSVSMGAMVRKHVVSDLDVTHRNQRFIPISLILMYYVAAYISLRYKLSNIYIPDEIYSMLLGVVFSLVIALFITRSYKLSLHALGISGVVGVVVALAENYQFHAIYSELFWITLCVAAFGLIGFSRLYLKHHSFYEYLTGAVLGFLVNYWLVSKAWFL
ncbi:MAG: hypothetical protein AB8B53_05575 [Flavobacteriales bacterium]